ncbi:DUF4136 domain-containing protein [Thalassomonas sp. M1454]|uniref:DUF4136 domain-containing protein n=1 Tax=Thalassomonas sp. M1454 TaxID=2594477 RepID=UPI00163D4235|nr:DUF4136 domain-containing protein [Thalassomonas sp. M1454]
MKNNLLISVLLLVLSGCATTYDPAVDYNPEYNFDALQTYAIVDAFSVDDSQSKPLNRNLSDLDNDRVLKSLNTTLASKGMTPAPAEQADMLVKYLLVTQDKTKIRTYNSGIYNCWRCRGLHYPMHAPVTQVDVKQYVEGTLIIDIVDPAINKSVWRSVVSKAVKGKVPVEERQAKVQELIDAMMASFKAPLVVEE